METRALRRIAATVVGAAVITSMLSGCFLLPEPDFVVSYVVTGDEGTTANIITSYVAGTINDTSNVTAPLPWTVQYHVTSNGGTFSNNVKLEAVLIDGGNITCDVLIDGVSVGADVDIDKCSILEGNVG